MDKSDIRLEEVLRSFLMYQEDRNHSPKTVRWYSDMLGRFVEALGREARLRDIDSKAIRRYLRNVRSNGLSKFTLHAYARTLKTFLRWLEREGYLESSVSRHVEMPKVPKYDDVTIDVLTDEEIAHLLSLLDASTDVGCRDRAIVCLMMESGLRLDEVARLKVDDVHLKDMYVKVRGKGDKEGYVPIGPTTLKALSRYMAHFRVPADLRTRTLLLNIFVSHFATNRSNRPLAAWRKGPGSRACTPISYDTPLRPGCWPTMPTFIPYSGCFATPTSAPHFDICT